MDHNWSMHVLLKLKDFRGSYTPANEHSNAKSTILMILFTKIFRGYVSLSEDLVQVFFPLWTQQVSNSQISEAEFDFRGWFFFENEKSESRLLMVQNLWWIYTMEPLRTITDWCCRDMLRITWEGNETLGGWDNLPKLKWCNRRRCGKTTNQPTVTGAWKRAKNLGVWHPQVSIGTSKQLSWFKQHWSIFLKKGNSYATKAKVVSHSKS